MAEDNKMKRCPVTLQPDIEELLDWNNYSADDFDSASQTEKKDFIQERQSVSYWKDAWRRLKKNVVAMVALGVIIFLVLFAFVGPYLVPYGYDQFNKGAENLHPTHYTLEDTQKLDAELAARTSAGGTKSAEEMIAEAEAEAAAKGEKLTSVDIAKIKAKAKVAAQNAQKQNEEVDVNSLRKELGIKKHLFGYSTDELQRKANGEKVFPHVFGTDMYGRDILVRVMYGARVSMSVGICAAFLVLVIGATYGAISGYCGGKVDAVMQRIVEVIYSVPEMLVVLLIATALKPILTDYVNTGSGPLKSFVSVLGPNLISMFIAFGMLYWVTMSRIIRDVYKRQDQSLVGLCIHTRHGTQKSHGIWMCRFIENIINRPLLYDLTCIHNGYFITDISHNAQVMGDENDTHLGFLLQILHQLQDLCLDGHIQSRSRLICDQQIRAAYHSCADHNPLTQTAAQFMGKAVIPALRFRNPHIGKHLNHRFFRFFL